MMEQFSAKMNDAKPIKKREKKNEKIWIVQMIYDGNEQIHNNNLIFLSVKMKTKRRRRKPFMIRASKQYVAGISGLL